MISDLQLRECRASERTAGKDQEMLTEWQNMFFSATPPAKGKHQCKKKAIKCSWQVTGQRNAAHLHSKSLDHQLLLTTGAGLIFFTGADDDSAAVIIDYFNKGNAPPTLTLHLDEGSQFYAMAWYLSCSRGCGCLPFDTFITDNGMTSNMPSQMLDCGMSFSLWQLSSTYPLGHGMVQHGFQP